MKGNTVALILRHIPCILDISVNNRPYDTFHLQHEGSCVVILCVRFQVIFWDNSQSVIACSYQLVIFIDMRCYAIRGALNLDVEDRYRASAGLPLSVPSYLF